LFIIGRSLSAVKDLVQSLGAVTDLWLDPKNSLREETIQALQVSTGFSRRQVELAITNCFEELTAPKITAYITSFEQIERENLIVLHVLPSNVFTAWVHGAVTTLLLGHQCLLKPSSREPVFARAWKKSLAEVDDALGRKVDLTSWDQKTLSTVAAVVAYGSDETLCAIRSELPPGLPFAGYGHKLSVGIIFQEALNAGFSDDLLDRVRRDTEPFRLQGCLSPQILYVQGSGPSRWPELEASVEVAPKIRAFEAWESLRMELAKFAPYLSCVGYAGSPDKEEFLQNELWDLNISRVSPLGQMQRPPLSWRNGGIFLPDLLH
jgi:hypothetical protein